MIEKSGLLVVLCVFWRRNNIMLRLHVRRVALFL